MRSFVLLAAFVALASANPFGWTRPETGNLVQGRNFLWQTRFRQQSPIQEFRQQTRGAQIVNPQQQDVNSIYTQDAVQSAVAEQTAQEVLEQALLARQRQTIQGIQQLQRQLDVQGVTGSTEQVSTIEAIRNLQKWLQIQQLVAPQILVNSELTRTLETVIRAQLTSDNEVGTRTRNTQAFQTRVQQLIDISNINEIEVEILNQQAIISQLQAQQQLVAEQIQQIQSQQTISSSQLQNAVVELQQQGQRLTVEILARQLVIQQLQQALVQQQQQLQQDIQQQVQDEQQTGWFGVSSGIQQWNRRDLNNRQSEFSSQTVNNPFVGRSIQTGGFLPFVTRQNV